MGNAVCPSVIASAAAAGRTSHSSKDEQQSLFLECTFPCPLRVTPLSSHPNLLGRISVVSALYSEEKI